MAVSSRRALTMILVVHFGLHFPHIVEV
jgi:hypothetical protein